jgi:iduronate 2-sulfatase
MKAAPLFFVVCQHRERIDGDDASVSFFDAQIGRSLGALDELNMARDTIVILLGNHGLTLGE